MKHVRRLHLDLPAAERGGPPQPPEFTPEQAAILNLLDRVEALEREIARLRDG